MRYLKQSILIAVVVLLAGDLWAANSVVVESKSVPPGASGVSVGVFITNDVSISAVNVPLEIRSVTPGSYISNSIATTTQGRLLGLTSRQRPTPSTNSCSGPVSNTYEPPNGTADFVSPDAIWMFSTDTHFPGGSTLASGSDGVPNSGTPSYLITFDVTTTTGTFEIDSCCFSPTNHVSFNAVGGATIPVSFTKGTITIDSCGAVCNVAPADVNCDGFIDALDMSMVVDIVFFGLPVPGPCCVE